MIVIKLLIAKDDLPNIAINFYELTNQFSQMLPECDTARKPVVSLKIDGAQFE